MKNMIQGTITLASGAGVARSIGLVSIPVLARLYTPEDFGVLALYMSVLLILVPISTLRYLTAIPLPRQHQMAFAILALSIALSVSFSLLLLLVIAAAGRSILGTFGMDALLPYALLIPLGVLLASLVELFAMWATRQRAYRVVATTQIWQASLGEGLKIIVGAAGPGPIGLLIGQTFGYAGGLRNLIARSWRDVRSMAPRLRRQHVGLVARRFSRFPLTRVPAQLLLALAMQAPVLLMASYYDIGTTGQMAVAIMAVTLPVTVVGQAASRAFYAEAARASHAMDDQLLVALRNVMLTLGIVALPFATILFFFAEPVAVLILGPEWAQTGRFASCLGLALVPQLVATSVYRTLDLLEAHVLVVGLHAARLVLVWLNFTVADYMSVSPEQAVLSYSLILFAHYVVEITVIYLALRNRHAEAL